MTPSRVAHSRRSLAIRHWRESKAVRRARSGEILHRLQELYPDAAAELNHRDPFQFLTAVILSAQTTDVSVNSVTPELFRRYRTPSELAAAPQGEIEELVRPTGFFRMKAKAIRTMAAQLIAEFDGRVPQTMDELLRLHGVARKTANVVLGGAFGVAVGVVVDTHVSRLAQRLGLTRATDPVKIERDLMDLIEQDKWIFAGIAIIWHGRRVCDAKKPDCDGCSLSDICPSSLAPVRPRKSPFAAGKAGPA